MNVCTKSLWLLYLSYIGSSAENTIFIPKSKLKRKDYGAIDEKALQIIELHTLEMKIMGGANYPGLYSPTKFPKFPLIKKFIPDVIYVIVISKSRYL